MKQIIPILIATASISNAVVQNQTRASADITNYSNLVQSVVYDVDQTTIRYATYYQVKEFSNEYNLRYATVNAKGYTRIYVNYENYTITTKTDYYFIITYEDGQDHNFTFEELALNLRGYQNPNNTLGIYYEDYYLYYSNTTIPYVDTYVLGSNYNYTLLMNVNNATGWTPLNTTNHVETVEENTTLTIDTKYTYLKWEVEWKTDDIYDEENPIPQNQPQIILNKLIPVYSSSTAVYTWTIDVQYTQEVIDIPGLLFEMLGMPFAWISTAFNVTLFSGTPYAINVSRLFFELICTLILIIILRKVLK